jgi:DNA-binding MarR family transcriptional regulator
VLDSAPDTADGSPRPACLFISKLAMELLARISPHLTALGINGRDYMLLAVLDSAPTGSQAELAGLCSLLPAQLVPKLDELERSGLVERCRDERDRRRTMVCITPLGRATLKRADAAAREIEDGLLGPIDGEVLRQLGDSFRAAMPAPS